MSNSHIDSSGGHQLNANLCCISKALQWVLWVFVKISIVLKQFWFCSSCDLLRSFHYSPPGTVVACLLVSLLPSLHENMFGDEKLCGWSAWYIHMTIRHLYKPWKRPDVKRTFVIVVIERALGFHANLYSLLQWDTISKQNKIKNPNPTKQTKIQGEWLTGLMSEVILWPTMYVDTHALKPTQTHMICSHPQKFMFHIWSWGFCSLLFFQPRSVVVPYVNHYLLQIENSLMRAKKCINSCV